MADKNKSSPQNKPLFSVDFNMNKLFPNVKGNNPTKNDPSGEITKSVYNTLEKQYPAEDKSRLKTFATQWVNALQAYAVPMTALFAVTVLVSALKGEVRVPGLLEIPKLVVRGLKLVLNGGKITEVFASNSLTVGEMIAAFVKTRTPIDPMKLHPNDVLYYLRDDTPILLKITGIQADNISMVTEDGREVQVTFDEIRNDTNYFLTLAEIREYIKHSKDTE